MAISNPKFKITSPKRTSFFEAANLKHCESIEEVVEVLLENRGIKTKKDKEEFFNPKISDVTPDSVGISAEDLKKAVVRIKKAIENNEQIVVYGDYDVDGICASTILWETLYSLGAKVLPYIPHRIDEGYGLSIKGILNLKSQITNPKLIITVDNGIVAKEAVEFAKKEGIDVIITDHHTVDKEKPKAVAIVHTTKLCGAGVAYLLAQAIINDQPARNASISVAGGSSMINHLELAAIATVADMVPAIGANRAILKEGLRKLNTTKRIGLLAIFSEAGISSQKQIGTYEIGFIIGPRINAMGRMDLAIDSLRLLCTNDKARARALAQKLGETNKDRQELTRETVDLAISKIKSQKSKIGNLIFVSDKDYQQGVIGLVAGKLVEEFYKPSIVVSVGKEFSKASARSVKGFNITDFIRTASDMLVNVGGHPMAAGFTVETSKLKELQEKLEKLGEELITKEHLKKITKIDCEIPLSLVSFELSDELQKMEPFGMGNPTPVFSSKAIINDIRLVGQDGKHLKLKLKSSIINHPVSLAGRQSPITSFDGIAFGMGEKSKELSIGDEVNIAYVLEQDEWNGNKKLQLRIRDLSIK